MTVTFSTKSWRVDRGYVQDLDYINGRYIVVDADKRGSEEDTNYHLYDEDFKYLGVHTEPSAGHGSSSGFEWIKGELRVRIGHKKLGAGYFTWGEKGSFVATPQFPNGDITCDQLHDLLCVRVGERFRTYEMSTGKLVSDVKIKNWMNRFQGHLITVTKEWGLTLFVHRDVETNGDSEIRWFRLQRTAAVLEGRKNTSTWGDEGEGAAALPVNGKLIIHSVSRKGGNNAGRTIVADSLGIEVDPNPKVSEPESATEVEPEYNDRGLPIEDLPEETEEMSMAFSPDAIDDVYDLVEKYLPSMKKGGVYANKAGYHNSRNVLRSVGKWRGDYSIQTGKDKEGDGNGASAIDLTFSRLEDQIKASRRLRKAVDNNDPRLHGKIREWFGSFDGKVVVGDSIYRGSRASADRSHLWHVHISGWRCYNMNHEVWLGIAEVLCGVKAGTFTGKKTQEPSVPKPQPQPDKVDVETPSATRPLISLKAIREGIVGKKSVAAGEDGIQYQTMLNRFTGSNLVKDGELGDNTRRVTALAQLKVARANGNKSLDEGDCWAPGKRKFNPDLDGIPGPELFSKVGIINSDTQPK